MSLQIPALRWMSVVVLAVCVCSMPAQGAELAVPADYPTIQAAVDAAVDGDEVVLSPGIWTGPGNRDVDLGGKDVLVRSTDPADPAIVAATVVDCQGSAAEPRAAFTLNGYGYSAVGGLAGLTITGAVSEHGAVICAVDSVVTIRDCVITGNAGSGIYVDWYSQPTIVNCRIEGNTATGNGGGINLAYEAIATIERCVIRGNSAQAGGGIYCYEGWPDVISCVISDNYAQMGGGIWWEDSVLVLTNCTVYGNSGQIGGGLYGLSDNYYDTCDIRNSILWANQAGVGPQVALEIPGFYLHGDTLQIGYSAVQGGRDGIAVTDGWTLEWQRGNLASGPVFVDADGPDGDPATWLDNDYRLAAGSPGIDAGDPVGDYEGRFDVAGEPRVWGTLVDLGAYEAADLTQVAMLGDVNGDGRIDVLDLSLMATTFSLAKGEPGYNAACDLNADDMVDVIDLLMLAQNFGR